MVEEGGMGGFLFLGEGELVRWVLGCWVWRVGCNVLTGKICSLSSLIVPLTLGFVGDMAMRLNMRLL